MTEHRSSRHSNQSESSSRVDGSAGKQVGTALGLRVAIVCDWLMGTGGAERVVLELHQMYPEAPIYTSQYDPDPKIWYGDKWFKDADIRTGWLQKLPKSLRKFLPVLRAWTFSRLDLRQYDLVISSSGAEAKGVKTAPNTVHISYCHAPTHYYWTRYKDYLRHPGFGLLNPLARLGLKLLAGPMRRWDKKAAGRPDHLIANSSYTQSQIKKYYGRDSIVIHPPVDIERFKLLNKSSIFRSGFVTAGRQTPYKRIDLAVKACTKLSLPLTVIGNGPEHQRLIKMAGPTVKFMTGVSDRDMPLHFQSAEAFIFPAADDFGIVAVEALAAGIPVIAYGEGGATDYIDSKTGVLFKPQTAETLSKVLEDFSPQAFRPEEVRAKSQEFSPEVFHNKITKFIASVRSDSN
ncbi:MAG: glycosyltransferase [Candidatus Saccharimonadales bacterium]